MSKKLDPLSRSDKSLFLWITLLCEMEEKVSRFLSGLLRHFPHKFGIKVDENGWAKIEEVKAVLRRKYGVDRSFIEKIVMNDDKGRFELDRERIRAKYGHTIPVNKEWSEKGRIPEKLYHGTNPKKLKSIMRLGLIPVKRLEVHLSRTVEEAVNVGKRHCRNPVVLEIDAKSMVEKGIKIRKKGEVFTTDSVSPEFIRILRKF